MKLRLSPILTLLLLLSAISVIAQENSVKMWVENMTLPTYKVGDPDKSPIFYTPSEYQGAQRHMYPYPYIGDLSNEKVDKEYTGVFLENEYLKICITPEMGGRLYYAIDKTNDYNIVYYNHVVKPALIGMAGAWTSGGAEWNIPHHHRPTSFLPVDYTLVENSDGSKTVWVGEYEKRDQTRWIVGLTLEPGKAYVKTEFRYFNVTPVQNTFLFWANTAVHANENYQVIFPPDVEKAVFHAKTEFTNWPIANQRYQGIDFTKGQDVSLWKNTSSPTSFFAWETKQDFIGGIDHGADAGTVKVGDRFIFKGKKFWNWGPNEVGQRWDKKLTDNDGPYLELMMGAYSDNQPDYSFINPMSTKQGTMYYYGIKKMDNIKEASADFAINLEQEKNKAIIQVNATGKNDNITIILTNKGEKIFEETASINPAKPYTSQAKLPKNIKFTDLKIQLLSQKGEELISWQPSPKKNEPHPETYKDPADPQDYQTNDELWLAGLRLEQFGNANFDPEKYYTEALKRDPDDVLVNTQLGLHYLKNGLAEKAEDYLRNAVKQVTKNYTKPKFTEPLFYLGVSLANQEKYEEARELLYQTTWSYEWASPAYTILARIESMQDDQKRALENARKATLANPLNIEARNLEVILLRKMGNYTEAWEAAQKALETDPLNFHTLNEMYLISNEVVTGKDKQEWLETLRAKLRNEPDNYLEIAGRYGNAGFYNDAVDFLNIAASSSDKTLSNYPLIYYYLGYYLEKMGDKQEAVKQNRVASEKPVDYVFPYGEVSEKVLKAAVAMNENDANAYYYLGNVYANYEPEKAIEAWEKAISLKADEAIFYRNLAFAQANYTTDINKAVDNIMKAISLDSGEPRYFAEADDYMSYARTKPEKIASFIENNAKATDIHIKTIDVRLSNFFGDYDKAISILEKTQFRTEEGATFNIHVYWFDAHLLRGIRRMKAGEYAGAEKDFLKAMEFPANLESERDAKIGIAFYYLGMNEKLQGNEAQANEYFTKMVDYSYQRGWGAGSFPEINYYKGLASEELGKKDEADAYFERLIKNGEEMLGSDRQGQYSKSSSSHAGRVEASFRHRKTTNEKHANAYYLLGLGYLGEGDQDKANKMFEKALEMHPTHIGAKTNLSKAIFLGKR